MAVVTISRQMGSLGFEIGNLVADCLGYRVVWRELINEAALRSGTPDVALAVIDELGLLGLTPTSKNSAAYLQAIHAVVLELAGKGNVVLVGRAGQRILADFPGTVHVRLIAPFDLRIQRIAHEQNISVEAAHAQIEASDRSRRLYLKKYYQVDWEDASFYDLVINTGRISSQVACDLICLAARRVDLQAGK
ncbi:MAG TPA: cytidylate kinase-like family protein [Longilinea sp.]|nr:cytidylate kinase-like family protein [Longilinea sp.]